MVFFHCVLIFIIFDLIFKIPVSILQSLTNRFKGILSYIIIHLLSSAGMAFIFTPYLEGKRLFIQILLSSLMGIWGYSVVLINANSAKKKAMQNVSSEYGIVKESDNRIIASLTYIAAVPLFYFLFFYGRIPHSNFIYDVVGFFSKWRFLSIVAAIGGFVQFVSSLFGIISLFSMLVSAFSSLRNRGHK